VRLIALRKRAIVTDITPRKSPTLTATIATPRRWRNCRQYGCASRLFADARPSRYHPSRQFPHDRMLPAEPLAIASALLSICLFATLACGARSRPGIRLACSRCSVSLPSSSANDTGGLVGVSVLPPCGIEAVKPGRADHRLPQSASAWY
jgi:hypothetical protein